VEPPVDGVLVHGLFIEGAKWDRKKRSISEQGLNELYFEMPPIHFLPSLASDALSRPKPRIPDFICPCYKTSLR
jgi:dynein heavy chain